MSNACRRCGGSGIDPRINDPHYECLSCHPVGQSDYPPCGICGHNAYSHPPIADGDGETCRECEPAAANHNYSAGLLSEAAKKRR